jgi:hypothetical protein
VLIFFILGTNKPKAGITPTLHFKILKFLVAVSRLMKQLALLDFF